jgi:tRNA (guanine10-N2)-dimethyltransferase
LKEYFALVSGENLELAQAELNGLVRASAIDVTISWFGRMALIVSDSDPVPFLLERAALIKEAGEILMKSEGISNLIHDTLLGDGWKSIEPDSSFCIRVCNLARQKHDEYPEMAVRKLGEKIRIATGAHVSMKAADVRILLITTFKGVFVCKSAESETRRALRNRGPGRMHFFHPSMMNASLARAMCNLAGIMPNDIVLDPFCGGGGILYEILAIGAKPVGIDLSWSLLRGASTNLANSRGNDYCLVQGDARSIPIDKCNCIVTDPPYGRSSSTRGSEAIMLVKSLLEQAGRILQAGGRMCICSSSEMNISQLIAISDMKPEFHVRVPVHGGLTREVFVLAF